MKTIGRTFLRGLLVVVPVTVTLYILYWAGSAAEASLGPALRRVIREEWYRPGMGVGAGLVLVFVVGILMNIWLFRRLFRLVDKLLDRIPLVKTLYGSTRDLLGLFGDSDKPAPQQVVMVNVAGAKVMGFVTREDFTDLPAGIGGLDTIAVYIAMSYQLGGFTLMVPRSTVEPVAMKMEDAMRFALTAGVPAKRMETVIRRRPGLTPPAPPPSRDTETTG